MSGSRGKLHKADLLEVQRYVDGELSTEGRVAFEIRLGDEPLLQAAVNEAREQRCLFGDDPARQLPARSHGVADAVIDRVRRLPRREELMQLVEGDELADLVASDGRRWLIAAAVLLAVALLFGARLIRPSGGEAHARDEAELQQLDKVYRRLQAENLGLPSRHRSGR